MARLNVYRSLRGMVRSTALRDPVYQLMGGSASALSVPLESLRRLAAALTTSTKAEDMDKNENTLKETEFSGEECSSIQSGRGSDRSEFEKLTGNLEAMFTQEGIPPKHFAKVLKDKRMTADRANGVHKLVHFYQKMRLSRRDCLRVVARRPAVADLSAINKVEGVVRFMQRLGVSSSGVERILTRMPEVLLMPEDGIQRKLDYFASLALSDSEIAQIISKNGVFLECSLERNIQMKVDYFTGIGLTRMEVGRVFLRMPQIFRLSIDRQIKPTIMLFEKAGASQERIKDMVKSCPRLLGMSMHNHLDIKLWLAQEVMGKSIAQIFLYLPFFTLSLDNRILFRAAFLRRIRKEFKHNSLRTTFGVSGEKFSDCYGQNRVDRFTTEWEQLSRKERIEDACGMQWPPLDVDVSAQAPT